MRTPSRPVGVLAAAVIGLGLLHAPTAGAVQVRHTGVVGADPANRTPHPLDGAVKAIVQVGSRIIAGGTFTTVRDQGSSTQIPRSRIFAFDATTGKIDPTFAPSVDGEVSTIVPAADGQSVYIGGVFRYVNGIKSKSLARVDLNRGALYPGFKAPALDGRVKDMKLSGGRLFIGGTWSKVNAVAQPALAALNPATGAYTPFVGNAFAGPRNGGVLVVMKFDVTPDGTRLFAIGNFTSVDGQPRTNIAALDLGATASTLANWATPAFEPQCAPVFDTYMRDIDISPDGKYFVVVTTGGYGSPPSLCDTASRWATRATGTQVEPSWVNYSGGDTYWSVGVTGNAVYVGGHFRWQNNPFGNNSAAAGAVARSGLAALDPINGLPFTWNPGRTLGVGNFEFTATASGLWTGGDTDRIGNFEYHGRIAKFPLGPALVRPVAATLPGQVVLAGVEGSDALARRAFDGTTATAAAAVAPGGVAWRDARGAFLLDDQLYTAWADGTLTTRSFNGTSFGAPSTVNLLGLTAFADDLRSLTGMFYANGRIYYTVAGQSALYYRYYTPQSRVIGAQRFTASGNVPGIDLSQVRGLFSAGTRMYFGDAAGALRSIQVVGGVPQAGTVQLHSGPGVDGLTWNARAMFLRTVPAG